MLDAAVLAVVLNTVAVAFAFAFDAIAVLDATVLGATGLATVVLGATVTGPQVYPTALDDR